MFDSPRGMFSFSCLRTAVCCFLNQQEGKLFYLGSRSDLCLVAPWIKDVHSGCLVTRLAQATHTMPRDSLLPALLHTQIAAPGEHPQR